MLSGMSPEDASPPQSLFDVKRPPEAELLPSVPDGFSLAAAGDCLTSRPLSAKIDADGAFERAMQLVRRASVATGNLETTIFDIGGFRGHPRTVDDWGLSAPPAVAEDLAALGFRIMPRANNHAVDWGIEGLRETTRWVDQAGIAHAGTGETLSIARAPCYAETPDARIGLVSAYTTHIWDNDAALDQFGKVPGRPGVNVLRWRRTITAPPETIKVVEEVRRRLSPDSKEPKPGELSVFDTRFVTGEGIDVRYEADPDDLAGNLRSIRLGKQHSDLLLVSVHCHEDGKDADTPPNFLVEFAHAAIEAGADVFFGHGVHRLWPVELYRGRPILYGLGNFLFSDIQEPLHEALYANGRALLTTAFGDPSKATDADLSAILNAQDFAGERFFESIVAEIIFQSGGAIIRLHPIELGYGRPLTQSGIPRVPEPAAGESILLRVAAMSEPFGTTVSIRDGVGEVLPARDVLPDRRSLGDRKEE